MVRTYMAACEVLYFACEVLYFACEALWFACERLNDSITGEDCLTSCRLGSFTYVRLHKRAIMLINPKKVY